MCARSTIQRDQLLKFTCRVGSNASPRVCLVGIRGLSNGPPQTHGQSPTDRSKRKPSQPSHRQDCPRNHGKHNPGRARVSSSRCQDFTRNRRGCTRNKAVDRHSDDPNKTMVLMDIRNAFNCVDHCAVLQAARESFPEIVPWADLCYKNPSSLIVGDSVMDLRAEFNKGTLWCPLSSPRQSTQTSSKRAARSCRLPRLNRHHLLLSRRRLITRCQGHQLFPPLPRHGLRVHRT